MNPRKPKFSIAAKRIWPLFVPYKGWPFDRILETARSCIGKRVAGVAAPDSRQAAEGLHRGHTGEPTLLQGRRRGMRYLIVIASLAIAGCDEPQGVNNHIKTLEYCIRTVEVKGHEYLIYDGVYKGSIIHSASCPCRNAGGSVGAKTGAKMRALTLLTNLTHLPAGAGRPGRQQQRIATTCRQAAPRRTFEQPLPQTKGESKPEMTMADAVRIARAQAAKETGDIRAAITMLADLAQYHHDKRTRNRNARRRKAE